VCSNREKRMSDPVLEKYVIQVVLDTVTAFFSSPFSENSTSTEVRHNLSFIVLFLFSATSAFIHCEYYRLLVPNT